MGNSEKIKAFAQHYFYDMNFNVTCITNKINYHNLLDNSIHKAPNHKWKHLMEVKQTEADFENLDWENSIGCGLVLGYKNLIALDIDDCIDYGIVKEICKILGLDENYPWIMKSGSQCGYHILFFTNSIELELAKKHIEYKQLGSYVEDLLKDFGTGDINSYEPSIFEDLEDYDSGESIIQKSDYYKCKNQLKLANLFRKIEFKFKGHLVLPPSFHQSGYNYSFVNGVPKTPPNNLQADNLLNVFLKLGHIYRGEGSEGYCSVYPIIQKLKTNNNSKNKEVIYMILDTETNGLVEENFVPNLISISWILVIIDSKKFIEDKIDFWKYKEDIIKKKSYVIKNVGFEIDQNASLIHNIYEENIKEYGQNLAEVLEEFKQDVLLADMIVAHNYTFDSCIIINELNRMKKNTQFLVDKPAYCTMKQCFYNEEIKERLNTNDNSNNNSLLKRNLQKRINNNYSSFKWKSLNELFYSLFELNIEETHNSTKDCLILLNCVSRIIELRNYAYFLSKKKSK